MDSDSGRRHRPVQGRVGSKAKQALAELAALRRSGAKRVDSFEVEEETPVYDVVDEEQYAKIVKKRRDEGGAFVIDRNGLGYADIGEEVDWAREESGEEDRRPSAGAKRRGQGSKQEDEKPQHDSGAQRARMQRMFAAAAAKPKSKATAGRETSAHPVADPASTDALLAGILGSVAAADMPPPAASVALRTPSSMRTNTFSRVQPMMKAAPPSTTAPRMSARAIPEQDPIDDPMDDDDHEEEEAPPTAPLAAPSPLTAQTPAQTKVTQSAPVVTPSNASTPAVMQSSGAKPPGTTWKTPAPALPPLPATPATDCAARGWEQIYSSSALDMSDDASTVAHQEEQKTDNAAVCTTDVLLSASLPLNAEGKLPFYLLDAHEEPAQPGTVFLFGKVPNTEVNGAPHKTFRSCCVIVRNLQRNVLFVPRIPISSSHPEIAGLEDAAGTGDNGEAKRSLIASLHEAMRDLKEEVRGLLQSHGINKMTMKPVARRYAFENRAVDPGRHWVLKVKYAATGQGMLPLGLKGTHFSAVFGASQSLLESLTLKRRLMGPGWLTISDPEHIAHSAQLSWCGMEVQVDGHKKISADTTSGAPAPPLTLAALHVQTALTTGSSQAEIVAASVVTMPGTDLESTAQDSWRSAANLRHFSAVCKLGGAPFPPRFESAVRAANASEAGERNGGAILSSQPSERALLTMLIARLRSLDVDVLVGHNIAGYDLPILLHRLAHHKVPHWSSLGRLKRARWPSGALNASGGGAYGGGASPGALSVLAGRLLCDSYLAARELVKEVDYTLGTLSRTLLGESRAEVSPGDVPSRFDSSDRLLSLLRLTESDAWLSLGLVFRLNVLPLTRALAALSGSSWSKSLMSQRAQRIESLLLHEFYTRKFLLPDKLSNKDRAQVGEGEVMTSRKGGKGPQYAGGLVLEPKVGLYDRFVLLLDFNSLYPSIIQEYNICFTTVARPENDSIPPLPPPSEELAVLPRVLQTLVHRRRAVKDLLKSEKDPVRRAQLEIRQQALKLTANSMYGCLGFSHSRFYARPLAELVTSQGREVLQSTVDLVQGSLGAEVIYGDTDSIMIHTGSTDVEAVMKLGHSIKREVNKRYRLLEIDMDGIYKRMLLLKKKKYAAIKVDTAKRDAAGALLEVVEQKGLDIVRRDWCPLAKDVGNVVLNEILSGKPREDVVAAVHNHLDEVKAKVLGGLVPLHKYIITKQLTKSPSDYPDAQNQPHVQVALRRLAAGKRDGVAAGETVPYVICDSVDAGNNNTAGNPETALALSEGAAKAGDKSLAMRAYHPQEVSASATEQGSDAEAGQKQQLRPSVYYYLSTQVLPVVMRLCAPIEGTDGGRLAMCLGLDPSRYRGMAAGGAVSAQTSTDDVLLGCGASLDDDDRFKNCSPIKLSAINGTEFKLTSVRDLVTGKARVAPETVLVPPDAVGMAADDANAVRPLTPAQLCNQITLAARKAVTSYYEGWAGSDDPLMPYRSRNVYLRVREGGGPPGSTGPDPRSSAVVHREINGAVLYTQLCYLHRCVDVEGALKSLGNETEKIQEASKSLMEIRPALDAAAQEAVRFKNANAHRWVKLDDLFAC